MDKYHEIDHDEYFHPNACEIKNRWDTRYEAIFEYPTPLQAFQNLNKKDYIALLPFALTSGLLFKLRGSNLFAGIGIGVAFTALNLFINSQSNLS